MVNDMSRQAKAESPADEPARISPARFAHVNLVAVDWRRLADFYRRLLGCEMVPPPRHYAGALLEAGTGLPGAELRGAHLRLPGFGERGPTLEIYTYAVGRDAGLPAVNRSGYGHIAFEVDSVTAARRAVLDLGGSAVGKMVTLETATGSRVTWCYMRDPEGNVIELQSWQT